MVRTQRFHCQGPSSIPGPIPGGGPKIPQAAWHAPQEKVSLEHSHAQSFTHNPPMATSALHWQN